MVGADAEALDKLFSSTMVVVDCLPYPFQCGPAHLPSLLEFLSGFCSDLSINPPLSFSSGIAVAFLE